MKGFLAVAAGGSGSVPALGFFHSCEARRDSAGAADSSVHPAFDRSEVQASWSWKDPFGIDGGDAVRSMIPHRLQLRIQAPSTNWRAISLRHCLTWRWRVRNCPGAKAPGIAFLQTEEQLFGIGIGLFVEPLLNLWPDCFKWVRASAPGSRSTGCSCDVLDALRHRATPSKDWPRNHSVPVSTGEVSTLAALHFTLRQHALGFSNATQ